jgi:hypothetical protein
MHSTSSIPFRPAWAQRPASPGGKFPQGSADCLSGLDTKIKIESHEQKLSSLQTLGRPWKHLVNFHHHPQCTELTSEGFCIFSRRQCQEFAHFQLSNLKFFAARPATQLEWDGHPRAFISTKLRLSVNQPQGQGPHWLQSLGRVQWLILYMVVAGNPLKNSQIMWT